MEGAKDTSGSRKPRAGRPRKFDREAALETAMRLFWRYGYEGVSISDLTKAIGVAAPSIYSAFGNKADLYRETLDLYEARIGVIDIGELDGSGNAAEIIENILVASARAAVDRDREAGCMVAVGSIACGPEHDAIRQDLARRREHLQLRLADLLDRVVDKRRAQILARTLVAVMQGLSIQARDGATLNELLAIIDNVNRGLAQVEC